ncbi:MAG TPA: hypothetical protein VLB47_07610 [Solirubrobacteraceae bacterium]|nr:hypothetical protein [Solirubrobacteraceae bacterium]
MKGNGEPATLRFYLVDEASRWAPPAPPVSRLAAARASLREAQQAEWEERQRLARARPEGLTPTHVALLQARQAQTQAAQAVVEDLIRRATWLRQAVAMEEEALAAQRRVLDRLRRELADIVSD